MIVRISLPWPVWVMALSIASAVFSMMKLNNFDISSTTPRILLPMINNDCDHQLLSFTNSLYEISTDIGEVTRHVVDTVSRKADKLFSHALIISDDESTNLQMYTEEHNHTSSKEEIFLYSMTVKRIPPPVKSKVTTSTILRQICRTNHLGVDSAIGGGARNAFGRIRHPMDPIMDFTLKRLIFLRVHADPLQPSMFFVALRANAGLKSLNLKILQRTKVLPEHQVCLWGGVQLVDGPSLIEQGVLGGHTIHLRVSLFGGGKNPKACGSCGCQKRGEDEEIAGCCAACSDHCGCDGCGYDRGKADSGGDLGDLAAIMDERNRLARKAFEEYRSFSMGATPTERRIFHKERVTRCIVSASNAHYLRYSWVIGGFSDAVKVCQVRYTQHPLTLEARHT